jgi:hypothetical protein
MSGLKFRYHGEQDASALAKWMQKIGANTQSLSDGSFVQVGRCQYTAGGNPKKYRRIGGIITNTREDAWALFERLCAGMKS